MKKEARLSKKKNIVQKIKLKNKDFSQEPVNFNGS